MSLYMDWWMLLLFGIVIAIIKRILQKLKIDDPRDSFFSKYAFMIVIISFYVISLSMFCGFSENGVNPFGWMGTMNDRIFNWVKINLCPEYYAAHPNATSTEFMYSSGLQWLKDKGAAPFDDLTGLAQYPYHLFVGIIIFCLYPYFLKWGLRIGEIFFGSKPGKKGVINLL